MKASELVAAVILKATGKTSTSVSGDTKWTKVLGIANYYIDSWMNEPDVDWFSLYDPLFVTGTVSNTDTYELDGDIRKISDSEGDCVVIDHSDGVGSTSYDVVTPDRLKLYYSGQAKENSDGYFCAQIGTNLVFNHKFVSTDPQYGGTIKVPSFTTASHLVRDNDVVPVDIPNWLVLISAAEYVRNDITRQNQYPNLISEANQLMVRMKADNEAQISEVLRPWGPMASNWS